MPARWGDGRNGEGFRTPARSEMVVRSVGRRSKASQGGNRGEEGRWLVGRDLWGFEGRGRPGRVTAGAGGAHASRRERGG